MKIDKNALKALSSILIKVNEHGRKIKTLYDDYKIDFEGLDVDVWDEILDLLNVPKHTKRNCFYRDGFYTELSDIKTIDESMEYMEHVFDKYTNKVKLTTS